jgi:hypothetical protein
MRAEPLSTPPTAAPRLGLGFGGCGADGDKERTRN